ncbi:hypothetical protein Hdeb2414_s0003g00093891 [Helianthus debilis subsp. tardiflorus]
MLASIVEFEPSHNTCCVYDEKLPKMDVFKDILEFMKRLPIQKALTNQHRVFRSHIAHFWKNAQYDDVNDVINSSVIINCEDKEIIITEQLVREVLDFPDDENSPRDFQREWLKVGGYDVMKDYQLYMVTALVLNKKYNFSRIVFHYMKENITSKSRSWMYPRFVQMMLDHTYPDLVKDEDNDLLVLNQMDNETLIRLSKYHKNWPESKTKTEFFGFIKSANYKDPDPVNHLKWRNDKEMKEKSAADELTKFAEFKETRNEWFTKEVKEKKKRGGKRTPKVQHEEGSSSQPQKKCKKKAVETMLVDEPEEDETEANVDKDQEQLSPKTEQLMKSLDDTLEVDKSAGEKVGDDKEKSSSDEEESDIDAETKRWNKVNFDPRERLIKKKRKRSADDDDDETYEPTEDVQVEKTPPSGGRKKSTTRKRVVSPAVRKLKITLKKETYPRTIKSTTITITTTITTTTITTTSTITTTTTITTKTTITTT